MQVVFETDLDLDTQALIVAGYHRSARKVLREVTTDARAEELDPSGHSGLAISAHARRGSPLMPAWFLDIPLDCSQLSTSDVEFGIEFDIASCSARFFDYGVAILMIHGWVGRTGVGSDTNLVHLVRDIELFSDSVPTMFLQQMSHQLARLRSGVMSVDDKLIIDGSVAADLRAARDGSDNQKSVRPLWVHRLLAVEQSACSEDDLRHLVALQANYRVEVNLETGETLQFVPGQGTSVLLCAGREAIPDVVVEPLALLNAYYAGSTKYDEAVFWGISQLQAISHGRARHSVSLKADAILALQERVLLFRAAVDHQAHNLAPQEQLVWQKISAAWNLEPLIDGVASNVATLDGIFQHVAESRRSEQADRLSLIVTVFTGASILGVAATLFPIVAGDPAELDVVQRVWILGVLALFPLMLIGLVALTVSKSLRRKG